jgi:hypothetical protein
MWELHFFDHAQKTISTHISLRSRGETNRAGGRNDGLCCTGWSAGPLFLFAAHVFAADDSHASISKMQDNALKSAEREIVSLAEAMPADKYDFAPTEGEFKGVRTFGQQMAHIAAVNDLMAAAILGKKGPVSARKRTGLPA